MLNELYQHQAGRDQARFGRLNFSSVQNTMLPLTCILSTVFEIISVATNIRAGQYELPPFNALWLHILDTNVVLKYACFLLHLHGDDLQL